MRARRHLVACVGLAALLVTVIAPAAAQAGFGIRALSVTAINADGTIDTQAGSHPYEWTLNLAMNLHQDSEEFPEGSLSTVVVDLPAGMVGNPLATPRCKRIDFEGITPRCPPNTQIGFGHAQITLPNEAEFPIYNLVPPVGVPVSIGFSIDNHNSFQEASIRTGGDYGASVSDVTIPTTVPIQAVKLGIWGAPAVPGHDAERICFVPGTNQQIKGCATDAHPSPFLTLPTSCTGPLKTTVTVESLEEPGVPVSRSVESTGAGGGLAGLDNCDKPPFSPTISVRPETTSADSPTGLHVGLHIPQNEALEGLATAHLKDSVVTLPRGLVVNPSAADGLAGCTSAQADLKGSGPAGCPAASKVGTVQIESPLVDHPIPGAVYLAKQSDNPFNSLLALYIAVDDPISGVIVKLAGKVEPDPVTGRLKAIFSNNPQLPFEDLDLDFFGGPRATLTTPPTCGTYTTETDLTPWTAPEGADAFPSDSFRVGSGANGGPCPASEAQAPHAPSFTAGTVTPIAGSYSPFVLKVSRENGSQRIAGLDATLPKGLAAKFAGIPYCSEAQLAAAKSREAPNRGALEQSSPSCPLASEVGTVTVGAGSGAPLYVQGHAYLAGPYKGAPLSLAIVTPAVAGPFDLGAVVVRAALYVNSETAQGHAVSDPIPTILQGIPLDVRSIAIDMSRPEFTLNPTSCAKKEVTAAAISATGQAAPLSSPFQVGACGALGFKPKLALSLKGATKRTGHPALRAVLTYPKGSYANIARAQVTLPHSEFLDTTHIGTVCTRVQFAADACPKASVYGHARAFTPLLDKPLEGPVYLRSSSHKLPDLVAALDGQIDVDLVGRVDTGKANGIRNTFQAVPDAPVSKFVLEMKGGKKGLLVNSEDICSKPQRAIADFTAHNAKVSYTTPLLANSCGRKSGKAKRRHRPR